MDMIILTEEEFHKITNIQVSKLPITGILTFADNPHETLLKNMSIMIDNLIKHYNPRYNTTKLVEAEIETIKEAIAEQTKYVVTNGDFSNIAAYDEMNNNLADLKSVRARTYSPTAFRLLEGSGLLYRGYKGATRYDGRMD